MSKPGLYSKESFYKNPRYLIPVTNYTEPALEWDNLVYSKTSNNNNITKPLLSGISGHVCSGEMVLILGPSQDEKEALLNALAGRLEGGTLNGTINYLNATRNPQTFNKSMAYIPQNDSAHTGLTFRETLDYTAELRLDRKSYSAHERAQRVDASLREMDLEYVHNSRVIEGYLRDVPSGKCRRLRIATELLINPHVLFLNEPVLGLYKRSSEKLINRVRIATKERGLCTLATIYKPNEVIFDMFDRVILIAQGRVFYNGPTQDMIRYFADLGCKCPRYVNPSEFFVGLVSLDLHNADPLDPSRKRIADLAAHFDRYSAKTSVKLLNPSVQPTISQVSNPMIFRNSWIYECTTLCKRTVANSLSVVPYRFFIGLVIFLALYTRFVLSFPMDSQLTFLICTSLQHSITACIALSFTLPLLTIHHDTEPIYTREHAANAFRMSSCFVAHVAAYCAIIMAPNMLHYTLLHAFSSRISDIGKYFVGLTAHLSIVFFIISMFLLIVSFVKRELLRSLIVIGVVGFQIQFNIYIVEAKTKSSFHEWVDWINPLYYAFSALDQNEFNELTFKCDEKDMCFTDGKQLLSAYGLNKYSILHCFCLTAAASVAIYTVVYRIECWRENKKYVWI